MLRLGAMLLVLLAAGPAWAKREKPDPLREAQKLVAADKTVEATKIYGNELAVAQKKGDVQWQQRVVRAIAENIKPHMIKDRPVRVLLMHTLMDALDGKQAYAFLYAGGLAYNLLHEMTAGGDRARLDKVLAVCALQAKRKHAGLYEEAMLHYAEGLQALEAGKTQDGLRSLDRAFKIVRANGWLHTALHVGTELAAALVAKGDAPRAALALANVAQVLTPRADVTLSSDWIELIKSRLKDAPEVALKPYHEFVESDPLNKDKRQAIAEANKPSGTSKLAPIWKKVGKTKPFATVTRKGAEFEITAAFNKDRKPTHLMQPGVTHFYDGGLTISFWDNRVRLFVADLEGWRAIPAISYRPYPLFCFTPLTRGSTWGINRKGQVIIKHPKE